MRADNKTLKSLVDAHRACFVREIEIGAELAFRMHDNGHLTELIEQNVLVFQWRNRMEITKDVRDQFEFMDIELRPIKEVEGVLRRHGIGMSCDPLEKRRQNPEIDQHVEYLNRFVDHTQLRSNFGLIMHSYIIAPPKSASNGKGSFVFPLERLYIGGRRYPRLHDLYITPGFDYSDYWQGWFKKLMQEYDREICDQSEEEFLRELVLERMRKLGLGEARIEELVENEDEVVEEQQEAEKVDVMVSAPVAKAIGCERVRLTSSHLRTQEEVAEEQKEVEKVGEVDGAENVVSTPIASRERFEADYTRVQDEVEERTEASARSCVVS